MSKTVLVVDDSPVIRAAVKFALGSAGFDVAEACDGQDGLAALERIAKAGDRPVLIISDVNMPKMDGIAFTTEVKKTANRFVPVLILTTESQESKKAAGRAAGAAGWLVKPFQEAQLLGVVKKLVRM